MKRRDFVKRSLMIGASAVASSVLRNSGSARADAAQLMVVKTVAVPQANDSIGLYPSSRAPLRTTPFVKLPVGSIKPHGWLRHQLDLQLNGLCGRYAEVSDYLKYDGNGWIDPTSNTGGEEVTYWLRGLTPLGFVTGDERVTALATKWMKGMIASQQSDGWFGPDKARRSLDGTPDFWPHMPALFALRCYHEATGDSLVLQFLTRYFAFLNQQKPEAFTRGWAYTRWGDTIDALYWLHNRTGDSFLIDLVHKIHSNCYDWTNGPPSLHNVNFAQGFREPAQYGLLNNDLKFLKATHRQYDNLMAEFGQMAGGGFAGDENARHGYRDPRQALETCGIAEFMQSFQILNRLSGEPIWMDRCEEITFNMLPAAFDPEQKVTHYATSMNIAQIDNVAKTHGQFNNIWAMQAFKPGVHDYRCCPHNYGMAWPMYSENLWHATADGGLAANLYAASTVTAKVASGFEVTIEEETNYPFDDLVNLTFSSTGAAPFPLYLRIPHWCDAAVIHLNGQLIVTSTVAGSYLVMQRSWKAGDVVRIQFPMALRVRTWKTNQNAVSIDRGPLTYSLAIEEQWTRYAGTERWPEYSVLAQSPWNYGLELDKDQPEHAFDVTEKGGPLPANPFKPAATPIELQAKARKIVNWQMDSEHVVTTLQPSPVRSSEAIEKVRLIPMGAARLRITSFPVIGDGPDAHDWIA
jgi:hypothetical protein